LRQDRWYFCDMQFCAKDLITLNSALNNSSQDWEAEVLALAAQSLRESGRLQLQVRGESMLPTLWPGDVVEISKCRVEDVRPGEIVLALRDGRFFLHRFVARLHPEGFRLRGDSMPAPDPGFPKEALLGRLAGYAGRGEKRIGNSKGAQSLFPLRPCWWAIGQLCCYCGPVRRLALELHSRKRNAREARRLADAEMKLGTAGRGAS